MFEMQLDRTRTYSWADPLASSAELGRLSGLETLRASLTHVRLRPLRRGETEPIRQVFDGMSGQSRFLRFLAPVPYLTPSKLAALSDVDNTLHVAWAGFLDGQAVGIGRYVVLPSDPHTAEIALSVVDAYQGHGIGRALLDALSTAAARNKITQFAFSVHRHNERALRLFSADDARVTAHPVVIEGRVPVRSRPARLAEAAEWPQQPWLAPRLDAWMPGVRLGLANG